MTLSHVPSLSPAGESVAVWTNSRSQSYLTPNTSWALSLGQLGPHVRTRPPPRSGSRAGEGGSPSRAAELCTSGCGAGPCTHLWGPVTCMRALAALSMAPPPRPPYKHIRALARVETFQDPVPAFQTSHGGTHPGTRVARATSGWSTLEWFCVPSTFPASDTLL